MKNINEWQIEQKLNSIGPNWAEWYAEIKDAGMKSFREWKLQKNVEVILEQEPPVQPAQLPPPVQPGQLPPPVQPPSQMGPQSPQPPTPDIQGPPQQSPEPQQPPPEDDKTLISSLQGVLGEKIGSALMPSAIALKEEAKKTKSLADQKQMSPADALKMWLWTCVHAWEKAAKSQSQQQPQPPQSQPPPQPQPPQSQPPPQPQPPQVGPISSPM